MCLSCTYALHPRPYSLPTPTQDLLESCFCCQSWIKICEVHAKVAWQFSGPIPSFFKDPSHPRPLLLVRGSSKSPPPPGPHPPPVKKSVSCSQQHTAKFSFPSGSDCVVTNCTLRVSLDAFILCACVKPFPNCSLGLFIIQVNHVCFSMI